LRLDVRSGAAVVIPLIVEPDGKRLATTECLKCVYLNSKIEKPP